MEDLQKKKKRAVRLIVVVIILILGGLGVLFGYFRLNGSAQRQVEIAEKLKNKTLEEAQEVKYKGFKELEKKIDKEMLEKFYDRFSAYLSSSSDYKKVRTVTLETKNPYEIEVADGVVSFYVVTDTDTDSVFYCDYNEVSGSFGYTEYVPASMIQAPEEDTKNTTKEDKVETDPNNGMQAGVVKEDNTPVTINGLDKLYAVLTDEGVERFQKDLKTYLDKENEMRRAITINDGITHTEAEVSFSCKFDTTNKANKKNTIKVVFKEDKTEFTLSE
ncbi:hypothetical protein M2150_001670 [Lachnospiraceae bacterium PM6-15]|uniref:hypothetical protein n=1 Tax=Ohessyouella blattaphilus TaxID=2949333 RepID=UPI003E1E97DD